MLESSIADYFLATYFTLVALIYSLRLLFRGQSRRLLFVGAPGSRHWIGHMAFRVFRILIWGICVARIPYPELDAFLLPLLEAPPVLELIGAVLMCFGLMLVLIGHYQLGNNWSSGIDPDGPLNLVTDKLYRYSRNPMYAGVLIGQLGFFAILPSVFTLICLVLGGSAILNQALLEEKHLQNRFPEQYPLYRASVSRW